MARDFDGIDDVVSIGTQSQADADFTMCVWANPDTEGEGGIGNFFSLRQGASQHVILRFASGTPVNRPEGVIGFGTSISFAGIDNDITLNQWDHWAIRFRTSDNLKEIVKNGIVIASNSTDPGTTTVSATLAIGAQDATGVRDFDGRLADFRWFNVRLTDDEISMVARGKIVRPDQVKIWWPLGIASPEPDWSGNVQNGTVTGAIVADGPPAGRPFARRRGYQGNFTVAGGAAPTWGQLLGMRNNRLVNVT